MRPGGAHCVEQPSTGGSPNTNARGAETSRPTVLGSAGPASPSKVARPDQLTPAIAFRQGACLAGASLGAEIVWAGLSNAVSAPEARGRLLALAYHHGFARVL